MVTDVVVEGMGVHSDAGRSVVNDVNEAFDNLNNTFNNLTNTFNNLNTTLRGSGGKKNHSASVGNILYRYDTTKFLTVNLGGKKTSPRVFPDMYGYVFLFKF